MNTSLPSRISPAIVEAAERFNKKLLSGKPSSDDVKNFYEIIQFESSAKSKVGSASTKVDKDLNKRVLNALENVKKSIGTNKAVIESASQAVSYPLLIDAIDKLAQYVMEEDANFEKVKRKPPTGLL